MSSEVAEAEAVAFSGKSLIDKDMPDKLAFGLSSEAATGLELDNNWGESLLAVVVVVAVGVTWRNERLCNFLPCNKFRPLKFLLLLLLKFVLPGLKKIIKILCSYSNI